MQDDWDASSADEAKPKAPVAAAAAAATAPPKKMSFKKRMELKEAQRALEVEQAAQADPSSLDVIDWQEQRRLARQRELDSDLSNAADLLKQSANGSTSAAAAASEQAFTSRNPRTLAEWDALSDDLLALTARHTTKAAYPRFLTTYIAGLAASLELDSDIKAIASKLNVLANERTRAAKDAAKKNSSTAKKAVAKPTLGRVGASTLAYDDSHHDDAYYDDDDFM